MGIVKVKPATSKLKPLYGLFSHVVLYGGRASGKSWGVAEFIVVMMLEYNTRVLCCREIQKSIKDSSHRLLVDTIERYGLNDYFEITRDEIRCRINKSFAIFKGVKNNPASIKSLEGIDLCWGEEAQTFSQESMQTLIPTIRKNGSMCVWTFNPRLPSDPIYKMFLGGNPPANSYVQQINYYDNPFISETIMDQVAFCKANDEDLYRHIWLGECVQEADDILISLKSVVEAQQREIKKLNVPIVAGLDIARMGNDKSVLCIRQGNEIIKFYEWQKLNLHELRKRVTNIVIDHNVNEMVVDANGLGAGPYDELKASLPNMAISEFLGGARASDTAYKDNNAQCWYRMKEWIDKDGCLPLDIELQGQLTTRTYDRNDNSQIFLKSKRLMRKDGEESPDKADSLAMTFYQTSSNNKELLKILEAQNEFC